MSGLARGAARSRKRAAAPGRLTGKKFLPARQRKKTFALGFLASELAGPPHRFVLLSGRSFRRFLVEPSALHLAEANLRIGSIELQTVPTAGSNR
jgi:hypothetical protein